MMQSSTRPVFLNLFQIRQPVNAVLSILHRIAGVLLILGLPFAGYALEATLASAEGYQKVMTALEGPWVRILVYLLLWALCHHFLSGIRFFLVDLEWIGSRAATRRSAWAVVLAAPVLTVLLILGFAA